MANFLETPEGQAWAARYAAEHNGNMPGENSGESVDEAIANLMWSQDFAGATGQAPNQQDWEEAWWARQSDDSWFKPYLDLANEALRPDFFQDNPAGQSAGSGGPGGTGGWDTSYAMPPIGSGMPLDLPIITERSANQPASTFIPSNAPIGTPTPAGVLAPGQGTNPNGTINYTGGPQYGPPPLGPTFTPSADAQPLYQGANNSSVWYGRPTTLPEGYTPSYTVAGVGSNTWQPNSAPLEAWQRAENNSSLYRYRSPSGASTPFPVPVTSSTNTSRNPYYTPQNPLARDAIASMYLANPLANPVANYALLKTMLNTDYKFFSAPRKR